MMKWNRGILKKRKVFLVVIFVKFNIFVKVIFFFVNHNK